MDIKDVVCCVPGLRLDSVGLLWSVAEMVQAANGPDFGRAAEVEQAGHSQYF